MFYIVFNFAMAVIMFLFGIWFYRSKGQASNFLSGDNMKCEIERMEIIYTFYFFCLFEKSD